MYAMSDRKAGVLTIPHFLLVGGCSGVVKYPALVDSPMCRLSKLLWCRKAESRGPTVENCHFSQELSMGASGELKVD